MAYGSDFLTGGTATARSYYQDNADYAPGKAVDDSSSTRWAEDVSTINGWWKYDLGSGVTKTAAKLTMSFYNDPNQYIKGFVLYGSNNDSAWDTVYTGTMTAKPEESFEFSNSTAYRYYKVIFGENDIPGYWYNLVEISMNEITGSVPNTPTNTTPAASATGVAVNPTLIGSTYSDADSDAQTAAQFQVADSSNFTTNLVWDSGTEGAIETLAVNTTNGTFSGSLSGLTKLSYGTVYYWRLRYSDGVTGWSSYSTATSFTVITNSVPTTPTNSTPASATTGQAVNPTLTGSAYSDPDSDAHYSSQWQIAFANDFTNNKVWDSGTTTSNKTSVVVNSTNGTFSSGLSGKTALEKGIPYYWKVRYNDNVSGWSSYSTPTYFVVINPVGKGLVLNPITGKFDKIKEYPFITSASLYQMPASTDTNAPNNSFYWSLTQNALCYKNGDGDVKTVDLTAV